MNVDNIIIELNEIKSHISEINLKNVQYKNHITNDYDFVIFLERYMKNRKMRNNNINSTIFLNPSWDILVELCYARMTRKPEYVSSIVRAGGTPPTTGLRHLGRLQKMGYVEREKQIHDKRRTIIRISDEAFNIMRDFFVRASRN